MSASGTQVTVLGIGNPIMGDDGIGLAILDGVRAELADPRVQSVDGGTSGMELLPVIEDAPRLLVLDAVAGGEPPGTVLHLDGDQLPRLLAAKLSPHQVGLLDLLAAARLLGTEPEQVDVVGIVPASVDLRVALSDQVEEAVPEAVRVAHCVLDSMLAAS